MKNLLKKVVGDTVYKECYSSMGASSTGNETITKISFKYDEDTGKKYKVIHTKCGTWDSRTGDSISNKSSMFYIE